MTGTTCEIYRSKATARPRRHRFGPFKRVSLFKTLEQQQNMASSAPSTHKRPRKGSAASTVSRQNAQSKREEVRRGGRRWRSGDCQHASGFHVATWSVPVPSSTAPYPSITCHSMLYRHRRSRSSYSVQQRGWRQTPSSRLVLMSQSRSVVGAMRRRRGARSRLATLPGTTLMTTKSRSISQPGQTGCESWSGWTTSSKARGKRRCSTRV